MKFSNLISTACLFLLWNNLAFSKDMIPTIPTGKKTVRFVCQRYNSEKNNLMDRVIILDQLSTKPLEGGSFILSEVTGERLVDMERSGMEVGELKGRLRFYENVSLFNFTYDPPRRLTKLTEKEDFAQRLEDLLKTQASKYPVPRPGRAKEVMDYSGTIERTWLRSTDIRFTGNRYRVSIYMDASGSGFPVAFLGPAWEPSSWPYVCGTPLFVEEMIEK